MEILKLDHVVLTVKSIPITVAFYEQVLGLRHVIFDGQYHALHFGSQKINMHLTGNEYQPHARTPVPGSGDLCLIASGTIEDVISDLRSKGVEIAWGPVRQTGGGGEMMSVYFRDEKTTAGNFDNLHVTAKSAFSGRENPCLPQPGAALNNATNRFKQQMSITLFSKAL
jgi:catechol 2,3-dioxygenase-like lactoylglutathione lyase family enzyme